MAECKRDSVCGVIRLRRSGKSADPLDHLHDLLFFGTAVTDDSLLDLKRCVFIDLQPGVFTREQDHAPAVRHGNTGRDIRIEKQFFDRHRVRLEKIDQLKHIRIDLRQTGGETRVRRRRNNAALYKFIFPLFAVMTPLELRCQFVA